MSRFRDLIRRRRDGQAGFTLVEIMVAITLVAIAAGGAVPLLIVGMKASATSRLNTQAKNLAQQRLESMRDLQYHVDRQNGPFVDLLDIYYTNLSTTAATRTRAGETEVAKWVSGGAAAPAPSGPFFQITIPSVPGFPSFSQTIDTQFLDATGAMLPASYFPTYDSQTEGKDQPPTPIVGITVTTTWADHGVSKSYTAYTRIGDGRGLVSAVLSQGVGEFLRVSSTGSAGNALAVDLARAEADGGQSTGSQATADVRALQASDAAGADYMGATGVAASPGGSPVLNSPVGAFSSAGGGDCGWVGAGPTQVSDVTASTTSGLPQVPSDLDTNSPPLRQAAAQVTTGGNTPCGVFGFANQSTSYTSALMLAADMPLVRINNDNANTVVVSGSAWVGTTSGATAPHSVKSGASSKATRRVQLFPGAGFVGDNLGVVDVTLSQSSIACTSTVSTGGAVTDSSTGSWTATIDYWKSTDSSGGGTRVTLPYTWSSSTDSGSADPLASLNPAGIVVYQNGTTTLHLSDYIASWSTARSIVENPGSGLHQLSGIVSITTQPVRDNDIISALGLQVGNLSCAAVDAR